MKQPVFSHDKSYCPFCDPKIENSCFASSQNFLAIYNIAPILPGHTLIIPKQHLSGFLDLDDNLIFEFIQLSKKVIRVLNRAFNTDSYDWTIQDGKAAGQTIDHMHMHIIPRVEGDLPSPGDWYPKLENYQLQDIDSEDRVKLSDAELQTITKHMKQQVSRLEEEGERKS